MMSRFPKLTETFVLDEMLEMERAGVTVEIFPLWREKITGVMHAEVQPLVDRAHFAPTLNARILLDNLYCLITRPVRYLTTLIKLMLSNRGSLRFLLGAIAIFPKACSFSLQMQKLGVQHVHAHFASHPAAAAFVIGRMSDIPWSFTAHGSDLHRNQSMLREKVADCAFAVTISNFNKRFILERIGQEYADKVQVVHCGVELDQFSSVPSQSEGLQLICIGTLHAVKGQAYLLRACSLLRERNIDFTCHLVGDGEDRAMLESMAQELNITSQVIFHGACDRRRVRTLLSQMDVAVAPSVPTSDGRREGIPVALMEAAACGLALVASNLSGIPELVRDGETGLLAEPGDSTAIAAAIAQLAESPELGRSLGDAVRQHIELEFNLSTNVGRLKQLMLPGVAE
jgi:glycosyltransferase involved in cell wall biosynthesis